MANIKVNHRRIEITANDVDNFLSVLNNGMKTIENELYSLGGSWKGADYNSVLVEWRQMKAFDSTTGKMSESLKSYSEFLRFTAETYKKAQAEAVNIANKLPK